MKCQVVNCNNDATHIKKEISNCDETNLVLSLQTETFLCGSHAEIISKTNDSEVSIDTF